MEAWRAGEKTVWIGANRVIWYRWYETDPYPQSPYWIGWYWQNDAKLDKEWWFTAGDWLVEKNYVRTCWPRFETHPYSTASGFRL